MLLKQIALSALLSFLPMQLAGAEPRVIELKDGGKIIIEKRGTMIHLDAAGNRVRMKDGQVMHARDGGKVMMKNDAIWKTITEHGTLKPGH